MAMIDRREIPKIPIVHIESISIGIDAVDGG